MAESDTLEVIIIEEGHGMKDISCHHGSRWIWHEPAKEWVEVIMFSGCDCGEPPSPYFPQFKEETTK